MKNFVPIPETQATTAVQINNLLSIVGTMMAALTGPTLDESISGRPDLDGGSKSAAELTFISACNALTDIISDKTRWNLTLQRALEAQGLQINNQYLALLKEQRAAVALMATPAVRFKPDLVRLQDGMYCVFLGDISNPETALVGIGNTAEQAFRAFDDLFAGVVPEHMIAYLLEREQQLKNNEKQTLVRPRPKHPKKTKGRRAKPRRDS